MSGYIVVRGFYEYPRALKYLISAPNRIELTQIDRNTIVRHTKSFAVPKKLFIRLEKLDIIQYHVSNWKTPHSSQAQSGVLAFASEGSSTTALQTLDSSPMLRTRGFPCQVLPKLPKY